MTILEPRQLQINAEDNFIVTNESQPFRCIGDACPSQDHVNERPKNFDPDRVHQPETLHLIYARRPIDIPVGASAQVPFDHARKHFGDPRSVPNEFLRYEDFDGKKGDIPPRNQEVHRLAGLYGLYDQDSHLLPNHPFVAGIKITTVGTPTEPAREVFFPAMDPEGEVGIYGRQKPQEQSNDIATLLAEMRAEQQRQAAYIENLESRMAAESKGQIPEEDGEITRDAPRM